jgi:Ni/Co efflux regulator RcnB
LSDRASGLDLPIEAMLPFDVRSVAPYRDWRYSTVRPGYQLRPGFSGQRHVVANPGHYRLRAAVRNQRWIRYGNDLLLVNARNGRVLQVVRNRYW